MALLGNYSVLNKGPIFQIGGNTIAQSPGNWENPGRNRNRFTALSPFCATPNGYVPPYCFVIAQKSGGMATYTTINGEGSITAANLAAGINLVATLAGDGTISSATGALVVSAVATILSSGTISSANLSGKLEAIATLAGTGSVTAAIGALASLLATLPGTGTISNALMTAIGSMSGDIQVNSTATITNESLATAVWNSLAADFNDAGTMGELLNGAGGGSSPSTIADAVRTELAPELALIDVAISSRASAATIAIIEKILRNKSVTDPTTGIMTIYDDDGVTPLLSADTFENVDGTQPYRGQGADRRDRLE